MSARGLLLALALMASTGASAHCYSVWRYPWPQRCGVARQMARPSLVAFARLRPVAHRPVSLRPIALDIPLPSLARTDCIGGEADEPTRARILLRAALEASNAH
jgi:hypothetical protein